MKKKWITVLLVLFVLAVGASVLAGCGTSYEGLHIDAPARVEADLGMYKIPMYNVVDANGAIYSASAYEDLAVKVKSVKDQNNKEVTVPATNSIMVREPGEYEFVYGVEAGGVEDAVVIVDFADRTAPTVTLDEDIPDMYIVGNSYAMPLYTLAGDYEQSKCYAKLYLADDDKGTNLQDVTPEAGDLFEVKAEQKGKYYMLHFHAEDAAGNVNDYKYYRPVDGPSEVKDNTVVYFNDEFGVRQVSPQESYYSGSFVTAAEAEEAGVPDLTEMPGEEGYYKLAFSGKDETNHNEAYLSIDAPAISDVRAYTELSFWVYFDPGDTSTLPPVSGIDYATWRALVGTTWWGDTNVPVKTWTKVTFNVQNWSANGNPTDEYKNQVFRSDISGFRLRFFWDYEERLLPYGTFYVSRLTATPGVVSTIVPEDGRVWPSESTYYIGQTVTLNAEDAKPGETFDCFKVDGQPIPGNTFVASKEEHTVEAVYVNGALTPDNMTWGTQFEDVRPLLPASGQADFLNENRITAMTAGESENWALSFDVTGGFNANESTNQKFGVSIYFGNTRTLEFQVNGNATGGYTGNFKHYGNGNYNEIGALSQELVQKFINASDARPVHFDAVRLGDYMHVFIDGEYFYTVTIPGLTMYGNFFGYAWRVEAAAVTTKPTIVNAKAVTGEEKARIVFESISESVTVTFENGVTADKTAYFLGETVKLNAPQAPAGKVFLRFTVNGSALSGSTYMLTKNEAVTFGAEFSDLVDVAFSGGAGYTGILGAGCTITLKHDAAPEGKVFDYYLVNGSEKVFENSYTLTADTKTIAAVYVTASASQMTWKDVTYTEPTGTISTWGAYEKLGSDANWVVTYEVTATNAEALSDGIKNAWFAGVLVRNNQLVGFEMGDNRTYKQHLGSAGDGTGSTWDNLLDGGGKLSEELVAILNGASEQNPVKLIFARQGNKLSVYVEQGGTVYLVVKEREHAAFAETYGLDFGYGWRTDVGGTPTIQNIRFVIGEGKTQLYLASLTVKITTDGNVTLDKTSYTFGDTVTLTAAEAETGEAFAYFTVDGKQIDGNTFVVEKSVYDVKAVYIDLADSYKIVLGEHEESVVTDGEYTIATASVADGEGSPVEGYTVVAKVTDETGAAYEVQDGKITLTYKGVMKYTVTYSAEGLEDKDVSYTVTLYGSSDGTIVTAGETAAKLIAANGTNATVTADTAQKYGSEAASVKITVNTVLGKQDYAYLPAFDFGDCDYIEFYAYTTAASAQIGAWWYGDTNLKQNEWTYVQLGLNSSNLKDGRWIIRLMNVAAGDSVYISSMKIVRHEGVILDLSKGATKGEWSTEKVYDGDDAAVDKTGALKLTPDSGDYYDIKATGGVMLRDIRKYSSVYFYVYTETEGAMVGVTWCGDTYPPAGQWTKVTITTDMYGSLDGDGGNMAQFRFRIKDGNGGTFYITSLYGVR